MSPTAAAIAGSSSRPPVRRRADGRRGSRRTSASTPCSTASRASSGCSDALERDRQRRRCRAASRCAPSERSGENTTSRRRRGPSPLAHVLAAQPLGEVEEPVAQIPLPAAEGRGVRAHDQRGATGGLSAPDDGLGEVEVGLDVELEPRPVGRSRGRDLLDRHGRRHAGDHDRSGGAAARAVARSPSGCASRWKAVGATRTGIEARRAEQRDAEVAAAAAAQHARDQADARERRLVRAQRDLVFRPAGEEVVHGGVETFARFLLEFTQRAVPASVACQPTAPKNAWSGSRCAGPSTRSRGSRSRGVRRRARRAGSAARPGAGSGPSPVRSASSCPMRPTETSNGSSWS